LTPTTLLLESNPEIYKYTYNSSARRLMQLAASTIDRYDIYHVNRSGHRTHSECPIASLPPAEQPDDDCPCDPMAHSLSVSLDVSSTGSGAFWVVPVTKSGWQLAGHVIDIEDDGDCCANLAAFLNLQLFVTGGSVADYIDDDMNWDAALQDILGLVDLDADYVAVKLASINELVLSASYLFRLSPAAEEAVSDPEIVEGRIKDAVISATALKINLTREEITSLVITAVAPENSFVTASYTNFTMLLQVDKTGDFSVKYVQEAVKDLADPQTPVGKAFVSAFAEALKLGAQELDYPDTVTTISDQLLVYGLPITLTAAESQTESRLNVTYTVSVPAEVADEQNINLSFIEEMLADAESDLAGLLVASGELSLTGPTTTTTPKPPHEWVFGEIGLIACGGVWVLIIAGLVFMKWMDSRVPIWEGKSSKVADPENPPAEEPVPTSPTTIHEDSRYDLDAVGAYIVGGGFHRDGHGRLGMGRIDL